MTEKNKRRGLLDSLLGKEKSTDVRASTRKAQALLDEARVTRKSRRFAIALKQDDAAALVAVVTDAVVAKLDEGGAVDAIVASPDTEEESPEEVKTTVEDAVATAVSDAVEEVTVSPDATAAAEGDDSAMMEGEMKSLIKSLGNYMAANTEDNGLLAQAIVDIAAEIKSISPTISRLDSRMSQIERLVNGRPRQASKARETETENDELEDVIKKGLDGEHEFLGIPVKSPSNGKGGRG